MGQGRGSGLKSKFEEWAADTSIVGFGWSQVMQISLRGNPAYYEWPLHGDSVRRDITDTEIGVCGMSPPKEFCLSP